MLHSIYSLIRSLTDPLALFLLLAALCLWNLRFLRKGCPGRFAWWTLLAGFVILYLLSITPVVRSLAYIMEGEYYVQETGHVPEIDIVVVLGGGSLRRGLLHQRDPSAETSSRLIHALQVMKRTGAEFIVFSGAGAPAMSEADVMAQISQSIGVQASKIMIEANSKNTWEHAEELNKLLPDKGVKVGLVTSALHMKRSIMMIGKYFPNLVPMPSSYIYSPSIISLDSLIPSTQKLYYTSTLFHEIFGLLWYRIRALSV